MPPRVILKRHKGGGWEEEFETEIATYRELQPLQGCVIPRYYGEIDYDGSRAILLEDVGGFSLVDPGGAVLSEDDLRPLLEQTMGAVADMDIWHDDNPIGNLVLTTATSGADKIVMVDLERVVRVSDLLSSSREPRETKEDLVRKRAGYTTNSYREAIRCLRDDGVLQPRRPVRQ